MDEHDKRAREVEARQLLAELECYMRPLSHADVARVMAAFDSTAAAAVAAERERWKSAADAVVAAWDHDEIGQVDGALIDALRSPAAPAPLASPAQAKRVSEDGWAANAERQLTRNGGWHVPGYSEDEHAVRFETVTDAHARGCQETQVRIAARLRARADEAQARAERLDVTAETRGTPEQERQSAGRVADLNHALAFALRAEADALEVGT